MKSYSVLTINQPDEWQVCLPADLSVFGSVEFAMATARLGRDSSHLFVAQHHGGTVAYPFVLRPLKDLSFVPNDLHHLNDVVTPDYTGPIAGSSDTNLDGREFAELFADYCQEAHIVSEFAHLHPWKASMPLVQEHSLSLNRQIVYVDATHPIDVIWRKSLSHSCRTNVLRAQQKGVRIIEAQSRADIQVFHSVYVATMIRRDAPRRYFLPLEYFLGIHELLPHNARFTLAVRDDRVVSGTLFMHDRDDMYAYLGGTDLDFQDVRPSNLVFYDAIQWAYEHGKKRLILGGGYLPHDGIEHFKATFSPLRAGFCVSRRIHKHDEYRLLTQLWAEQKRPAVACPMVFPEYRSCGYCSAAKDGMSGYGCIAADPDAMLDNQGTTSCQ